MTTIPNQQTHENRDERWSMIGKLVETYGTENDKIAWMLCRGNAAEWHIESQGGMSNIINKIEKERKTKRTQRKEKRIVSVVFSLVLVIASYITFKVLGIL